MFYDKLTKQKNKINMIRLNTIRLINGIKTVRKVSYSYSLPNLKETNGIVAGQKILGVDCH